MHDGVWLGLRVMQMAESEVGMGGVGGVRNMNRRREDLYLAKANKAVLW